MSSVLSVLPSLNPTPVLPCAKRPAARGALAGLALLGALLLPLSAAQAQDVVYRCPKGVFTNLISAKEAAERGCKVFDGGLVSVIPATGTKAPAKAPGKPASGASTSGTPAPAATPSPAGSRVDPKDQKARDADARQILTAELRKDEEALAQMRTEFNNGQPDKRGDEAKNHQKYLDRVASMQAAINRKEADIAALKRELAKLPN